MGEPSGRKVTIVVGNLDEHVWEGVYVNGVLSSEGPCANARTVAWELGIEVEIIETDDEWLNTRDDLPMMLADVVPRT